MDGETVAQATYTVENTEITVPEVPVKDGYRGKWSDFTLNGGNKIVKAVYEKNETTEPDPKPDPKPDSGSEPKPDSSSEKGGCKGDLSGAIGLPFLLAAAVVLKKKRNRN